MNTEKQTSSLESLLGTVSKLQNEIDQCEQNLKWLREKKKVYSDMALSQMASQHKKEAHVGNQHFVARETKTYTTLSQKYLKQVFDSYFRDPEESQRLLNAVLTQRETKAVTELRLQGGEKKPSQDKQG